MTVHHLSPFAPIESGLCGIAILAAAKHACSLMRQKAGSDLVHEANTVYHSRYRFCGNVTLVLQKLTVMSW